MSDLPSVEAKIQVEATRFRSAVSEFLAQGIGSSINFLIDEADALDARITALEGKVPNVIFGADFVGSLSVTVAITLQKATSSVRISTIPTSAAAYNIVDAFAVRYKRGAATIGTYPGAGSAGGAWSTFTTVDAPGSVGPHTYTFERTGVLGPMTLRLVAEEILL